MSGFFITFESIDGVGKSTQVNLLRDALATTHPVFLTKEPGDGFSGSAIGADIRRILFKDGGSKNLHPGVADLLFLADHVQTAGDVEERVRAGDVVICDRYADSQFAYSKAPSKRAPDWAQDFYAQRYGIVPDVTFLLLARGASRDDGTEDISWALDRARSRKGIEENKQGGKAWNSVTDQQGIQCAYVMNLRFAPRTVVIPVYESFSIADVHNHIMISLKLHPRGQTLFPLK